MFGRVMATDLHEPRYWHTSDALELIDLTELRAQSTKTPHDIVRNFLQKKLPASMLDRIGKEWRELDEIEARKELPLGKTHLLIPQISFRFPLTYNS